MKISLLLLISLSVSLSASRLAEGRGVATTAESGFLFFATPGSEEPAREAVSSAVRRYCVRQSCQFLLLLGNNLPHLAELYGDLRIDIFPVVGDRDDAAAIDEQLAYSAKSPYWTFPARYYSYTRGEIGLFAIDTSRFDLAQEKWLREELEKSRAKWKVVYGHRSLRGDLALKKRLAPLLEIHADFYLSSDGAKFRVQRGRDVVLLSPSLPGFGHLVVDRNRARVRFLNAQGRLEGETTVRKGVFTG